MSTIKMLMGSLAGRDSVRRETAKARVRKAMECESLEGRQLLSATPWAGFHADASTSTGTSTADVHHWTAKAGTDTTHTFTPPTLSAAAQADLTTLQTDQKTLAGELKADTALAPLTAAVKTDMTTIMTALGVTKPTGAAGTNYGFVKGDTSAVAPTGAHDAGGPRGPGGPGGPGMFLAGKGGPGAFLGGPGGSGGTLPAALVTKLEAKGITATQISGFEFDLKAVKTATASVDPTLQTKIKADETALQKAAPAPPMHFDHIMKAPTTSTTSTTTTSATN